MGSFKALVDCNNFFVSCERLFNPKLIGKPVVVLSNNDGCFIARSEEAKALGIPMGAPFFQYRDICLEYEVTVLSCNHVFYGDMSRRVMETLKTFGFPIEVYSIDEAFLEVPYADPKLGHEIRNRVFKWTGIPISIGIAQTKTLAKVANCLTKKKEGVLLFPDEAAANLHLQTFPIGEIWGIGRRLKRHLYSYGIQTAYDLKAASDAWLKKHLAITGFRTVLELRGIPSLEIQEIIPKRKSILVSRSFGRPVTLLDELKEAISTFTASAAKKARREKLTAHFLLIFISDKRFEFASDHFFLPVPSSYTPDLIAYAHQLLESLFKEGLSYKRAGVRLCELVDEESTQLDLFKKDSSNHSKKNLMTTLDQINRKFHRDILHFASEGTEKKWKGLSVYRMPHYTTSWNDLPVMKL